MLQRVDNISFGMKQFSVISKAKKSENKLSNNKRTEFNKNMEKIAQQVRINSGKAWQSAKNTICGQNIKKI